MKQIEILKKETIDQIAAGEVVERPASVVKELVENAIDAGADAITVEIRDGGRRLIRVTDNGEGIPADQIEKAFLRHATSKLRSAGDLVRIRSLGFRGEALSSIAAVARVECITKTAAALTGIRYRIEGGVEIEKEEIGAPDGTTFLVRDLFYNTPVREKFMKSAATEGAHIRTVVESLTLSHPQIALTFIHDGKTGPVTDGRGDVPSILYQIYGRELARNLIPFQAQEEGVGISGFLGSPAAARGNRNGELFFVNGRPVKSDLLSKATENGYHGYLMQHRYPFVLMYLEADGALVDVNVHPTKKEVRFSDRERIYRMVCLTVQNFLLEAKRIPEAVPGREQKTTLPDMTGLPAPEPFETLRRRGPSVQEPAAVYTATPAPDPGKTPPASERDSAERPKTPPSPKPVQETIFTQDPVLSRQARRMHRLIGQVFGTYWLMEYQEQLYIIDQHAAHEKVMFEQLMQQYRTRTVAGQMLYPAVVIEPGASDAALLRSRLPVLAELGYEIEEFGGDAFKITAVPANLYHVDARALLTDVLDQMKQTGDIPAESIAERLASMSCKAAVKGNTTLSFREADALIDELLTLENPYHCPHGRPVIIRMSRTDMDRKFKRII